MAGTQKPADYELPKDYQEAVDTGQLKKVADMYAAHYDKKMKL